jgi:TolB protein
VFQRYVDTNLELFVMNADGSDETRLTHEAGEDRRPTWSPDGGQVAFVRDAEENGNGDIYVINADGSGLRALTSDAAPEERPIWSSDGTQILFFREGSPGGREALTVHVETGAVGAIDDADLAAALDQALDSDRLLGIDIAWK